MTNPKTDVFSRVVAFIVALSIAMLTVTLIHRNIISAESGEAAESAIESIEASLEASLSEAAEMSEALENESSDTQENEYEELPAPDNELPSSDDELPSSDDEEEPTVSVLAEEQDQDDLNNNVKYFDAEEYIEVSNSEIYLNGSKISGDTDIDMVNGQQLSFFLEWNIPHDNNGDFDNCVFVWNISKYIENIAIPDVPGLECAMGTYSIINSDDGIYMYITPYKNFGGDYDSKRGSISLDGTASIDESKITDNKATLTFFKAAATVNVSRADISIQKNAGNAYLGADSNYYQTFNITVQNTGSFDASADSTVLVDIPGDLFVVGSPTNVRLDYSTEKGESVKISDNPDGDGYLISMGAIEGGQSHIISYDLMIDPERAVASNLSSSDKSNRVSLKQSADKAPQEAEAKMEMILPNISKSGTYDAGTKKITWKITVSPNILKDTNFTVTDIPDEGLQFVVPEGSNITFENGKIIIPKNNNFIKDPNGNTYSYTYETSVPDSLSSSVDNQTVHNNAEVTFDGYDKKPTAQGSVSFSSGFIDKVCNGIFGREIKWQVEVNIPDSEISQIKIYDYIENHTYGGNIIYGTNNKIKYVDSSVKVIANGGAAIDGEQIGEISLMNNSSALNYYITDQDFIEKNRGSSIIIKYRTRIDDSYDINLFSKCLNQVSVEITYSDWTNTSDSDSSEYKADIAVTKNNTGYWYADENWMNSDLYNNTFYPSEWAIHVNAPGGVKEGDVIDIVDWIPYGLTFQKGNFTGYPNGAIAFTISDDTMGNGEVRKISSENEVSIRYGETTYRPRLIISIKLKNKDDIDAINSGKYLSIYYRTVMTDAFYSGVFYPAQTAMSFENEAAVSLNGGSEHTASASTTISPKSNILDKKGDLPKNGDKATYTITINAEKKLFGDHSKSIVLTDVLGYRVKLDTSSIKIRTNDGETKPVTNFTYDQNTHTLTIPDLENGKKHVITYIAWVEVLNMNEFASYSETDVTVRDKFFGNNATISYSDPVGQKVTLSNAITLENVNAQATMSSKPYITGEPGSTDVINLVVKKNWDGDTGNESKRKVVIVKVTQKNPQTMPVDGHDPDLYLVLDKSNNWEASTPLVISRSDGTPYEYEVKEMPSGNSMYSVVGENPVTFDTEHMSAGQDKVVEFTNKYGEPKIDIEVSKEWVDTPPASSISFAVKANGQVQTLDGANTHLLNADNEWKASFTGLPKYDNNNNEIIYTVEEVKVGDVAIENSQYTATVVSETSTPQDGNTVMSFTIKNSIEDKIKLHVEKEWVGYDDNNIAYPDEIKFYIYRKAVNSTANEKRYGPYTLSESDVDVNGNNWSNDFEDKEFILSDKSGTKYTYYVKEITDNLPKGNEVSYSEQLDETAKVYSFTIKNTYKPDQTEDNITITVHKNWNGESGAAHEAVTFKLEQSEDGNTFKEYSGNYDNKLNADNSWSVDITAPRVSETTGKHYTYRITEINADNYIVSVSNEKFKTNDKNDSYNVEITNTAKVNIEVKKAWADPENVTDEMKNAVFSFTLNAGDEVLTIDGKSTHSLSGDGAPTTFTGLPKYDSTGKEIPYSVEETIEKNPSYECVGTQSDKQGNVIVFTITNKIKDIPKEPDENVTTAPGDSEDETTTSSSGSETTSSGSGSETTSSGSESETTSSGSESETTSSGSESETTSSSSESETTSSGSGSETTSSGSGSETTSSGSGGNQWASGGSGSNQWASGGSWNGSRPSGSGSSSQPTSSGSATDPEISGSDGEPQVSGMVTEPPVTTGKRPSTVISSSAVPNNTSSGEVTIESVTASHTPAETISGADSEDVSSGAGIDESIEDAVKRDTIFIFILIGIIITGTSILIYRNKTNKSNAKFRM